MKNQHAARLWFGLGGIALALLWVAIAGSFPWLHWAGVAFLSVPIAAGLAMTLPNWRRDRVSSLCALGLFVLFCIACFGW